MSEFKICPKCRCPCSFKQEFCVCGHNFSLISIFEDLFPGISEDIKRATGKQNERQTR